MNARVRIAVVCAAGVLLVAGCGQGTSRVANSTPEAAAKSFVKAMIAGDSKAIDALNKSAPGSWPTSRLLTDANRWGMVGSDISNYEITDKGRNEFSVKNKKTGKEVITLTFIFADGKYYFISY